MKLSIFKKNFLFPPFFDRSCRLKSAGFIFFLLAGLWGAPFIIWLNIKKTLHHEAQTLGWQATDLKTTHCSWLGITISGLTFYHKGMVIRVSDSFFSPLNWIFNRGAGADIVINEVKIEANRLGMISNFPPSTKEFFQKTQFIKALKINFIEVVIKGGERALIFQGEGQGYRQALGKESSSSPKNFVFWCNWRHAPQPYFKGESTLVLTSLYSKIETRGENFIHTVLDEAFLFPRFTKILTRAYESVATHGTIEADIRPLKMDLPKEKIMQVRAKARIYQNHYEGDFSLDQNNQNLLTINGAIDGKGKGSASIQIPCFNWETVGINIHNLIPIFKDSFVYEGGKVGANGRIVWGENALTPHGIFDICFDKASFSGLKGQYKNISGTIKIESFQPLVLSEQQSIAIEKVLLDHSSFENVNVLFKGNSADTLMLNTVTGNFLGGSFHFHDFKISDEGNLKFQGVFRNLKLKEGTETLGLKNLIAVGDMSGTGVFLWKKNQFQVQRANFLLNSSEATIKFTPVSKRISPSPNIAFEALKDLRCTMINLTVFSQELTQDLKEDLSLQSTILLKIVGFNSQVLNGYPFEYSIQTKGCLRQVIKNFKSENELEKQL